MSIDIRRIETIGASEIMKQMVYYAVDIHGNMATYTEEDGWKYINAHPYKIKGEIVNVCKH